MAENVAAGAAGAAGNVRRDLVQMGRVTDERVSTAKHRSGIDDPVAGNQAPAAARTDDVGDGNSGGGGGGSGEAVAGTRRDLGLLQIQVEQVLSLLLHKEGLRLQDLEFLQRHHELQRSEEEGRDGRNSKDRPRDESDALGDATSGGGVGLETERSLEERLRARPGAAADSRSSSAPLPSLDDAYDLVRRGLGIRYDSMGFDEIR